jgi:hypothetical protein
MWVQDTAIQRQCGKFPFACPRRQFADPSFPSTFDVEQNPHMPQDRSSRNKTLTRVPRDPSRDPPPITGILLIHPFRISDDARVAIGRICLVYTLNDRDCDHDAARTYPDQASRDDHLDPGFSAFERLEWMTPILDYEESAPELCDQVSWKLRLLLAQAVAGQLPAVHQLVSLNFPKSFARALDPRS